MLLMFEFKNIFDVSCYSSSMLNMYYIHMLTRNRGQVILERGGQIAIVYESNKNI